jgi:hypothetical protein
LTPTRRLTPKPMLRIGKVYKHGGRRPPIASPFQGEENFQLYAFIDLGEDDIYASMTIFGAGRLDAARPSRTRIAISR